MNTTTPANDKVMELSHLCRADGRRPRTFPGPIRKSAGSSSQGGAEEGTSFGITGDSVLGEKYPPSESWSRSEGGRDGPPARKRPKLRWESSRERPAGRPRRVDR